MIEAARRSLEQAGANWHFRVAAVEALPYPDSSFDIVMANHMLYHVSDIHAAVWELARVVKADGYLLASTNGVRHMQQLYGWMIQAQLPAASRLAARTAGFRLENGAQILRTGFRAVRMDRLKACLMVPAVEPVIRYAESMELVRGPEADERMASLRALLEAELQKSGTIAIDTDSGVFEARAPAPTML
jgi:SAM-dependent methyltransferase